MFAVFYLANGVWRLHATDATLSTFLRQEREYLTVHLGLTAAIFRRVQP